MRCDSVRLLGWPKSQATHSSQATCLRWAHRLVSWDRLPSGTERLWVGNICNASPAADTAPALLVYGSTVTLTGPGGERTMPLTDFFVGPGQTRCGPDEIVIRIDVPIPDHGHRSAFQRLTRRRGVDLATVQRGGRVSTPDGGIVLGLGCVGPTPLLTETSPPVDLADPGRN